MSLRATSRTDSKLVIYGSGGLASSAVDPAKTTPTPNHHTLKLEPSDTKNTVVVHQAEPTTATPTSRGPNATPLHRAMPPHRGSIGDVEHKSLSSVLRNHTHSSSPNHGSPSTRMSNDRQKSSYSRGGGEGQRSLLEEQAPPTRSRSMATGIETDSKQGQHYFTGSRNSLSRQKKVNDYQPPSKKEWYHSDLPSPEESRSFNGPTNESPYSYQASGNAAGDLVARSNTGGDLVARSNGGGDMVARSSGKRYSSSQLGQRYKHSSSSEQFNQEKSTNQMRRFHHSQSVDQIEREGRSSLQRHHHHHQSPQHHQSHQPHQHHHHHQHHYKHREREGDGYNGVTRSSKSNSDLIVRRKKSSSLPRDTPPQLQEEDEPEGRSTSRYVDHNHPARPHSRGQYRLSLPESTYYDNGVRLNRHTNGRRSRKALTSTNISTGSLSQPSDLGLGVSYLSPCALHSSSHVLCFNHN